MMHRQGKNVSPNTRSRKSEVIIEKQHSEPGVRSWKSSEVVIVKQHSEPGVRSRKSSEVVIEKKHSEPSVGSRKLSEVVIEKQHSELGVRSRKSSEVVIEKQPPESGVGSWKSLEVLIKKQHPEPSTRSRKSLEVVIEKQQPEPEFGSRKPLKKSVSSHEVGDFQERKVKCIAEELALPESNLHVVIESDSEKPSHQEDLREKRQADKIQEKKTYRRSKSEKPKRVVIDERKNIIRWLSETTEKHETCSTEDKNEFSSMSDEELNRKFEEFIQRINRQIRLQGTTNVRPNLK